VCEGVIRCQRCFLYDACSILLQLLTTEQSTLLFQISILAGTVAMSSGSSSGVMANLNFQIEGFRPDSLTQPQVHATLDASGGVS
jgi:hypothetical protein